ncbi:50S ribosomal protein L21e [Candidatus Woesearchaeota archaeon]|nr:50S ribosomal protein L21e [Candidatus Woesearchaeota archaeon]
MAARKGGLRSRTRRKFKKDLRDKGKISLTKYFTEYKVGEIAVLKAEPAVQKGLYHQRFHGKSGMIVGKKGTNYELKIKDGGKEKLLYVHPVHLKKR